MDNHLSVVDRLVIPTTRPGDRIMVYNNQLHLAYNVLIRTICHYFIPGHSRSHVVQHIQDHTWPQLRCIADECQHVLSNVYVTNNRRVYGVRSEHTRKYEHLASVLLKKLSQLTELLVNLCSTYMEDVTTVEVLRSIITSISVPQLQIMKLLS